MSLTPLQDYAKIQLEDVGPLSAKVGDTATDGILIDLPDMLTHYGFYSFAFESSLLNADVLQRLMDYWKKYIGKRVYWLALSEKGAILQEEDGTRFAYVKLTSLMAWSEPDEHAKSVLDKHDGSFAV